MITTNLEKFGPLVWIERKPNNIHLSQTQQTAQYWSTFR